MLKDMLPASFSDFIVEKATELGFDACGISTARHLDQDAEKMEVWLEKGFQARMSYLEKNREKRYNPSLLVDEAKSIISVLYNYFPNEHLPSEDQYLIAKYAYGEDYHRVVKDKLYELFQIILSHYPEASGRVFTDSAPFLDRGWAEKSGLGFIGKNTCLIHPRKGSFHFIGQLVISLPLAETGEEVTDYCGTCSRCIDACPTDAILAPHILDARKCISYQTIEYKGDFASDIQLHNWIFGCDICQDVCPWNRFSKSNNETRFRLSDELKSFRKSDWDNLSEVDFNRIFDKSAIQRAGFSGMKRNIEKVNSQQKEYSTLPPLTD
jgi:epoxyqueuosine reductase